METLTPPIPLGLALGSPRVSGIPLAYCRWMRNQVVAMQVLWWCCAKADEEGKDLTRMHLQAQGAPRAAASKQTVYGMVVDQVPVANTSRCARVIKGPFLEAHYLFYVV
jgi:hypothetical protein